MNAEPADEKNAAAGNSQPKSKALKGSGKGMDSGATITKRTTTPQKGKKALAIGAPASPARPAPDKPVQAEEARSPVRKGLKHSPLKFKDRVKGGKALKASKASSPKGPKGGQVTTCMVQTMIKEVHACDLVKTECVHFGQLLAATDGVKTVKVASINALAKKVGTRLSEHNLPVVIIPPTGDDVREDVRVAYRQGVDLFKFLSDYKSQLEAIAVSIEHHGNPDENAVVQLQVSLERWQETCADAAIEHRIAVPISLFIEVVSRSCAREVKLAIDAPYQSSWSQISDCAFSLGRWICF